MGFRRHDETRIVQFIEGEGLEQGQVTHGRGAEERDPELVYIERVRSMFNNLGSTRVPRGSEALALCLLG